MRVPRRCRHLTAALLGGVAALYSTAVAAVDDRGFYAGAGYQLQTYDSSGLPDADLGMLYATLGWQAKPWIGMEATIGTGINDDKVLGFRTDLERFYAVHAVPTWSVNDRFAAYAKLGWSYAKLDVAGLGSDADSDFGWGVGGAVRVLDRQQARLEYNRPYDDKGTRLHAWSLGWTWHF